ncbi:nucleoside triphosphate pyrophosphohydrolase [Shewanella chilikensis]|uniref:nucleoside triphosphate pyrophosphohydrolase n=1 Tax=Shewanella chilikensis TaxID=558541 RepID=UPI002DD4439B|nr:nucleoside triphosphate pyrophosphohydrolase [Shewanella chilikensis]
MAADINALLEIMAKLRDPELGCPWDRAQDFDSIVPYTLEEAYEVADAIESRDWQELPSELGDLLFQVVFYCQLGKEKGWFDFATVLERICNKLISRHPHVFAADTDLSFDSAPDAKNNWERIKAAERAGRELHSVLDDIPKALPALARAGKIQKRVSRVGFDWPELEPVVDKVQEEIEEVLHEARQATPDKARVEDEVGDLLFAAVNLARHLGVDPEQALRGANNKFERRFRAVEQKANASGKPFAEHDLQALDAYWDQVKREERAEIQ